MDFYQPNESTKITAAQPKPTLSDKEMVLSLETEHHFSVEDFWFYHSSLHVEWTSQTWTSSLLLFKKSGPSTDAPFSINKLQLNLGAPQSQAWSGPQLLHVIKTLVEF